MVPPTDRSGEGGWVGVLLEFLPDPGAARMPQRANEINNMLRTRGKINLNIVTMPFKFDQQSILYIIIYILRTFSSSPNKGIKRVK